MLRTGDIILKIAAGPNWSATWVWKEATIARRSAAAWAWLVAWYDVNHGPLVGVVGEQ